MKASYVKHALTRIGGHVPLKQLYKLQAVVNHLKLGRWMADHGFTFERSLRSRWEVFDTVASIVQDQRVLYLEFGVFKGRSIRYWAGKLRNPETRLHGFDSFEGLPEEWALHRKGAIFNAAGRIPSVADQRVRFFKGWFDQVLPHYVAPEHDVLIIAMDADLYSSTSYVLRQLRSHMFPGTYLYFDEMNHVEHEPRAFHEFMEESSLTFRPVCADRTLTHACFECTG